MNTLVKLLENGILNNDYTQKGVVIMKSSYIINNDSIINNAYSALPSTDSVVFVPCRPNPLGVYLA